MKAFEQVHLRNWLSAVSMSGMSARQTLVLLRRIEYPGGQLTALQPLKYA